MKFSALNVDLTLYSFDPIG